MKLFIKNMFKKNVIINSIYISLVVGTILNAINQGAAIVSEGGVMWGNVLLNYLVPYLVASYSAAKNDKELM